jgi:hypothetical protein
LTEGNKENLLNIQEQYLDKYEALTQEERDELVQEFTLQKLEASHLRRPTARARIQDVANVARNIELLVRLQNWIRLRIDALKYRCLACRNVWG